MDVTFCGILGYSELVTAPHWHTQTGSGPCCWALPGKSERLNFQRGTSSSPFILSAVLVWVSVVPQNVRPKAVAFFHSLWQNLPQAGTAGESVSFSCHNTLKNPSRSSEAPSLVPGTAFQTTSPLLYNLDQNALDHPRACVCWDQAGA